MLGLFIAKKKGSDFIYLEFGLFIMSLGVSESVPVGEFIFKVFDLTYVLALLT